MPTKLNSLPLPELRRTVDLALAIIDPAVEAMNADRALLERESAREKRDALSQSNLERVHRVSEQLQVLLPDFPTDVAVSHAAFATPSDWAAAGAEGESDDDEEDEAPAIDREQARAIYEEVKRLVATEDVPELREQAKALFENFEYAETLSRLADGMMRFSEAVRAWATASGEGGRGDLFLANLANLAGKRGGAN